MKRVLVIIVTYNGMRWLERCLSSVTGDASGARAGKVHGGIGVDVFVADNASSDGSAEFVESRFPHAILVRNTCNLGFSKANNLGFRYAIDNGYDYVYLLNQDAWLEDDAMEKLVAAAEKAPEYGVLSPMQYYAGGEELDREFAKWLRASPGRKGDGPVEVPFEMAAHWLVRVSAIKTTGPFNESLFPIYGQDNDWCNRLHYHGLKVGVVPATRAVHDRAGRQVSKEKAIFGNYYLGSLVRLCDIGRPLWERFCFVCVFTVVKAIKYRSTEPFRYFVKICRQIPEVRETRRESLSC